MPRPWLACCLSLVGCLALSTVLQAAALRVPQDHATLQAAIDAAGPGDEVVVAPGTYRERLRLKPGVVLRSLAPEGKEATSWDRAKATIIDGGGAEGDQPGVTMAEGSTLDGFTITNVGAYEDEVWQKHFESQGEELGDEEGAAQAEGTIPGISVRGVACTVIHCIVHHNGDVGISVLGATESKGVAVLAGNLVYRNLGGGIGVAEGAAPLVQRNVCKENLRAGIGCRNARPIIVDNECIGNIRAGIGCREGARPVIRGNRCRENRRAGIGIRMEGTAPTVEFNTCEENAMAGIGSRDGASPILRGNICQRNKMAGIGCRDGARPLVVDNQCRENDMAGIGVQAGASAIIQSNVCVDNKLVAIGVIGGSTASIADNELSRVGGQPPLVAIREGSTAALHGNRLAGGGVAAVLVEGQATISGNSFAGAGEKQGNAVWIWENSSAQVADNEFTGYRAGVSATKPTAVVVTGNRIHHFGPAAIVISDSKSPAHVYGNLGTSPHPSAVIAQIQGAQGIVENNELKPQ